MVFAMAEKWIHGKSPEERMQKRKDETTRENRWLQSPMGAFIILGDRVVLRYNNSFGICGNLLESSLK